VSANAELRRLAEAECHAAGLPLYIPPLSFCTDNAAMIGAAAYYRLQHDPHAVHDLTVDVHANLPLGES
jgi:N6-L-threonylcarbamoyladenine synthase